MRRPGSPRVPGLQLKTCCSLLLAAGLIWGCGANGAGPQDSGREAGARDLGPNRERGPAGDNGPLAEAGPAPDVVPWLEAGPDALLLPDAVAAVAGSRCLAPLSATLIPGTPTTLNGDTRHAPNEFGKSIKCGTGTDFDGHQIYYKLKLLAGTAYRMSLSPGSWDGALYLFSDTSCIPATIDAQCALNVADVAGSGGKETLVVSTATGGDYLLAVDSYSPTRYGTYSLSIEGFTPASNSDCARPTPVTISSTKVTIKGDTSARAVNQYGTAINCGGSVGLPGPQLYYGVTLTAGTAYHFTLKPAFNGRLYIFPAASCGVAASVNAACGSKGSSGAYSGEVKLGTSRTLTFKPNSSGSYVVAVDSASQGLAGSFDLELSRASVPAHDKCVSAATVTLSHGKGSVSGDTTLAGNDVALKATDCAGVATPGPDLFYKVTVSSGKSYRFSVVPAAGYDPALYLFSSCSSVSGTCLGGVDSGLAGGTESIKLTAAASATYLVGVDSRQAPGTTPATGSFSLNVEEYVKPKNDRCGQATSLSWSSGKASVTGDTFYATNEFSGVNCGGKLTFPGPQLYYKVALTAGKKYLVSLTPASGYDAALYAFPATTSCAEASINAACKGLVSDRGSRGKPEWMTIQPSASGSWIVAADSWSASAHGTFTLSVEQLTKPTNDTCASPITLTIPTGVSRVTYSGHTFSAGSYINLTSTNCTKNSTAGPDVFFQIKLEKDKNYKLSLDGSGYNAALYLFTSCSYVASTCTAGADKSTDGVEQLNISPTATLTYFIGVDGRGAADYGNYKLILEQATSPCSKVQPLSFSSSGVATATGDTSSGANDVNMLTSACLKQATPGNDTVFSINLVAGKTYTVTLTPATTFDPVLSASSTCTHPDQSCLKAADAGGTGVAETLTLTPTASGTHYIVVDSTSSTASGAFTLQIK